MTDRRIDVPDDADRRLDVPDDADRRLDVRDGDEPPFDRILTALADLDDDESLLLVNGFEPVPLYDVLDARGFTHETENVAEDEWHVRIERT